MRLYGWPFHLRKRVCNDTYRPFCPETLCPAIHVVLEDFLQHRVDGEPGYICIMVNFVLHQGMFAQEGDGSIESYFMSSDRSQNRAKQAGVCCQ